MRGLVPGGLYAPERPAAGALTMVVGSTVSVVGVLADQHQCGSSLDDEGNGKEGGNQGDGVDLGHLGLSRGLCCWPALMTPFLARARCAGYDGCHTPLIFSDFF